MVDETTGPVSFKNSNCAASKFIFGLFFLIECRRFTFLRDLGDKYEWGGRIRNYEEEEHLRRFVSFI